MRRWTAGDAREAIAQATPATLEQLCPLGAILVVAPHPDDESLGCGGLIALASDAGRSVTVALLTDGEASHPGSRRAPPDKLARIRRREVREALRRLSSGCAQLAFFGAADGGLADRETEALAWLEILAARQSAGSIFASWSADPHLDHQAASRIARRCASENGAAFRAYPVWGLTLPDSAAAGEAAQCLALDITPTLDRKRRAIAAHRSQTTGMIADSPEAFRLSPEDLARHLTPREPMFVWD